VLSREATPDLRITGAANSVKFLVLLLYIYQCSPLHCGKILNHGNLFIFYASFSILEIIDCLQNPLEIRRNADYGSAIGFFGMVIALLIIRRAAT
jgi:hypothetical protein